MDVSVVIPTYNRAALLKKTLGSVAEQTFAKWECIVVDDGSTDDTEAVVDEFGPDVRYVRQSNAGPAAARNRGLRHARGESVLFLDSDDLLLPRALGTLVDQLERNPEAGVAYGGYYGFLESGGPGDLRNPQLPPGDYSSPWPDRDIQPYGLTASGDVFPDLITYDCILMGTGLVRREVAEESGGFDPALDLMEHWDFLLHLACKGVRFVAVEEPVLLLRMHKDSLSSDFQEMLRCRLNIIDRYLPSEPEGGSRQDYCEGQAGSKRHDLLRGEARARAFDYLGCTMVFSGQLETGLRHVQKTLAHHPLPLETYGEIAEELFYSCNSRSNPEQKMRALLEFLGSPRNARSLRDYLLGRFLLVRAKRNVEIFFRKKEQRSWGTIFEAVRQAVLSCLHLTTAVVYRPELIRKYMQLIATKLMK